MKETEKYGLDDLMYLMGRLRDPDEGCPWDLKQDFTSIIPSTLEEVYEVVDAIEQGDMENLREELGDLVFQVVFYSQLASEEGLFDLADVVHGITEKLVRRHPHVFPEGDLHKISGQDKTLSDQELHEQWENIKQQEKLKKSRQVDGNRENTLLDSVPRALPAIQRAEKLQKKMAAVGFDWSKPEEVFTVVEGELNECKEAMDSGQNLKIKEELGDCLFALVNLCRHLGVNPEIALRASNNKVQGRFDFIERSLRQRGNSVDQATREEMEVLWQEAKLSGSSKES